MTLSTNIVRRGSIYYFRTSVPRHLRALSRRNELWRSLRTPHPTTARRRGAILAHLTERLWRDLERLMFENVERVDRAKVQSLIDRWLKSELEADSYRREAPGGEIFAGIVLRKEPAWKADSVVRRVTFDELADAEHDPFSELGENEYVLREVCDRDLERSAQRKMFKDSRIRVDREDETVAEEHVKALFTVLGIPIDEFSAKFETATLMMMRAHSDLWRAVEQRDENRWRPLLGDDPASALMARLTAYSPPQAPSDTPSAPLASSLGKSITEAGAAAIKAIAKKQDFPPKRIADYQIAVRVFVDFLQNDPDLLAVDSQKAGEFMRALEAFPSNASKRLPYRELSSFAAKLEAAAMLDEERLRKSVV